MKHIDKETKLQKHVHVAHCELELEPNLEDAYTL